MRHARLAPAALLLAAALACASSSSAVAPGGEDEAGGRLYREHCGSCHRLRKPQDYDAATWAWAVEKFGNRAHLSPEQRPLVLGWLQARAKDAPPPAAAGKEAKP